MMTMMTTMMMMILTLKKHDMVIGLARSTKNTSEMLRVSCDTRWQKAEQPIDPRSFDDNHDDHEDYTDNW